MTTTCRQHAGRWSSHVSDLLLMADKCLGLVYLQAPADALLHCRRCSSCNRVIGNQASSLCMLRSVLRVTSLPASGSTHAHTNLCQCQLLAVIAWECLWHNVDLTSSQCHAVLHTTSEGV